MKRILPLLPLALLGASPLTALADPAWIWSKPKAADGEKADFRISFEVPAGIRSANLSFTCDNGATALINGKAVGTNPDWQQPTSVDVQKYLASGKNELLIEAKNQTGTAALVAVLKVEDAAGNKLILVETGGKWEASPHGANDWKNAVVISKYGAAPWGDVLSGKPGTGGGGNSGPIIPEQITAPSGFKVQHLYTVPKAGQGSWVSMTVDKKGRLICGDQYGVLYLVTPPPVGQSGDAAVEPLDVHIGGAHGLLYAFDSLYVLVNESIKGDQFPQASGKKPGLYRLKDKDGNSHFDEPVLITETRGGGEHGPHSIQLSPDGKSIFFNGGNHVDLPDKLDASRLVKNSWDEDHILPRMWDANGHARGKMAPGGWICKTDPEGKKIELFCMGFRNEFDFAFDSAGRLFSYDADMEWDIGTPWYRPTRINHCVSGADFGWRSGSGKWPSYYTDSLPACVDIGPGSPTGVASGKGAKFPAKYQRAIFANDWTYGTMYAIHVQPSGAGVQATKEEFIYAKPLPLTDVVIHPQDGAMYFLIGGRRTQSALFRVTYEGPEGTAPAEPLALTPEEKQREEIEKFHGAPASEEVVSKVWSALGSPDRNLRFAARVALEHQPAASWADRALAEKDIQTQIEALIALARVGRTEVHVEKPDPNHKPAAGSSSAAVGPTGGSDAKLQERILESLARINFASLNVDHQLQLARAYQLAFTRLGRPDAKTCATVAGLLDEVYPAKDDRVNRELCQLLVFLDSTKVAAKTLALMATARADDAAIASDALLERNTGYARAAQDVHASRPNSQQISLIFALRHCKTGWTPELRKTFFSWFPVIQKWKGGNSFKGFLENTRKESLARVESEAERTTLDQLSKNADSGLPADIKPPKGPGRAYTTEDIVKLTQGGLKGRDFASGKNLYAATMCATCHRFGGDGGSIGPDLTGAGNRYSIRDLVENITEPSKVISDQYGSHLLEKTDGSLVVGRIISEESGRVNVMTNPFAPALLTTLDSKEVRSRKDHNVSMMPPGLINTLNEEELRDLLAYLLSGGNPKDKMFVQ
jgi:putative heme-binding domain-containing protein